jgi:prolyl-tRNA synthetase
MRGREFVMKDMYSCSINEEQHEKFYQETILAYHRIFSRVGVGEITYLTFASGGAFTEFSHEFQTICDAGEDYIYIDKAQKIAINEEVLTDKVLDMLNVKRENLEKIKTLETGNIFNFGLIKSEQTDFKFTNKEGKEQLVWFGSYGIGMTRLMGVIAEIYSDEKGLKWPQSVAPFEIHLVSGVEKDEEINQKIQDICKQLYTKAIDLTTEIEGLNTDYEILWDERNTGLGSKLGDSELIGCPWQILVTKRSLENGGIEIKNRATGETKVVGL